MNLAAEPTCEMGQRFQNVVPFGSVYAGNGEFNRQVVAGRKLVYVDPNYDGVAFYLSNDGNEFAPGEVFPTSSTVTLNGNPGEPIQAQLLTR